MASRVERLADLIVNFGANVQKGQILDVLSGLGKEELTRAITASAYRRGAKFVDVHYWDPHLKRERVLYAPDDVLDFVPPWYGERALQLGHDRGATISLSGPIEPHLFDLDKLWEQVVHICRLDEDDPEVAWRDRNSILKGVAQRLSDRHFDAIHLEGPGTDLTVGLLPTSRWIGGGDTTVDGIVHMANLPTEEVFSSPDPERTEGVVRATKPLTTQGRIIDGLTVRFEGGRAVEIEAESAAETLRALVAQDEGGARLGELALVDREGRIGPLDTVFYDTLLDENAASHIALGSAYDAAVGEDDVERLNRSSVHIDFMIGSPEVDVTGITRDGERVPVLRDSSWQI